MSAGTAMPLHRLVEDLNLASPSPEHRDVEVLGVACDSRLVERGDLFVAVSGDRFDGRHFAAAAVQAGAVAVVGDGDAPDSWPREIPWLSASDPRSLLGPLACRAEGHPDSELVTAGVTGTNGKSTVTALTAAIFDAAGLPAGCVGTLENRFRDLSFPRRRTTPEAPELFRMLRRMADAGAAAAALEISSHALELGRVAGLTLNAAAFTNLTRDHFDFHRDFESYFGAKARIFGHLESGGRAVVPAAEPWGPRLLQRLPESVAQRAVTWGEGGAVRVERRSLHAGGIEAQLATPAGSVELVSPLVGAFHLENLTVATAIAVALELPLAAIRQGIGTVGPLPGRLQPVRCEEDVPVRVFVDFAHTDAALRAALEALRELVDGDIVLVFGCGGDRDPGKRPLMGQVAGELATLPILTSDNPRSEDPQAIIREVEVGLKASANPHYRVVPDRREAIQRAVRVAPEGSVILLAGKGAETTQTIGDQVLPFSDADEARKALEERFGRARCG
ncbi:MAG: UDP-N-acetylmuramoyl-L-alanyl-D-glutamate--2,6-diaminopimelate ligase [Acidobacteriota bacterium]